MLTCLLVVNILTFLSPSGPPCVIAPLSGAMSSISTPMYLGSGSSMLRALSMVFL